MISEIRYWRKIQALGATFVKRKTAALKAEARWREPMGDIGGRLLTLKLPLSEVINYNIVMAPFNTHFLIAEKIWPVVRAMVTWPAIDNQTYYGQFCFGVIAPDVDKLSPLLTQKDTHFFDRAGDWSLMASHRSAAFIEQQAQFLARPFPQLPPAAQAFALGYLCHLCLDEVSKYMWRRETWLNFQDIGPGPAFSALDELALQRIERPDLLAEALDSIEPVEAIPRIPLATLATLLECLRRFVRAGTLEKQYLVLVDLFDQPMPEERQRKQEEFRAGLEPARQRVHVFRFETLLEAGLRRSRQRLEALITGQVPQPGDPEIS
jgi:hypothetical protein